MFERQIPDLINIIRKIQNNFGIYHRIVNCIEELSELQKCLTKNLRLMILLQDGKCNYTIDQCNELRKNTVKEIADVYLTIEEIKYIYNISDNEIIEEMKIKISRGVK